MKLSKPEYDFVDSKKVTFYDQTATNNEGKDIQALVCGETEKGNKKCKFVENYGTHHEKTMIEIEAREGGVEIKAGPNAPKDELIATPSKDKDAHIESKIFDIGY